MFLSTFGRTFARHGHRRPPLAFYIPLCILLHFYAPGSSASEPYLVADINRQIVPLSSDIGKEPSYNSPPVGLLTVDGIIYFFADDGIHGREFWRSDGTADGTRLVKDIFPGRQSSTMGFCSVDSDIVSMGGSLYFIANDGTHGLELWKSDGTRSGTVMVKDIHPGPWDSCPFELTEVDGTLFFAADDGVHRSELWRSDGTEEGTFLVKDIDPEGGAFDLDYYYPPNLLDLNGILTFVAYTNYVGHQLWRSDGTPDGTYPLVDLATMPPAWSVDGRRNRVVGDELYFFAMGGTLGIELWRTDGTLEGTMRITALGLGSLTNSSTAVAAVGTRLFFQFHSVEAGRGLWTSDGTEKGTQIVRGGLIPDLLTPVGDLLFFVSGGGVLWRSDGTEEGTVELVQNLTAIALAAFGDRLAFAGGQSETGVELWTSDGTAQGTQQVVDLNPGTGNGVYSWDPLIQAVEGVLYFTGDDGSTGSELWKSDGTAAGTRLVRNIRPDVGSSSPWQFRNVAGNLFFAANDGVTGVELWISTGVGARQVRDIREGPIGSIGTSNPGVYTLSFAVGFFDTLLFGAQDGVHGMALWRSDGTKDGTYLVRSAEMGASSGYASYLTQVGRQVFFTTSQAAGISPLWRTDGTEDGTYLLFEDPPWDYGAHRLTALNDRLIFTVGYLDGEYQTWRSDGTPEGTEVFLPITGADYTPVFSPDGDWQMFFYRYEPDTGKELWRTDGTIEGTTIVKDIAPGSASAIPPVGWYPEWAVLGTTLYLLADNGVTGLELWKSDGTEAGTQLVKDIRAGEESAFESLRLTPFEAAPAAGVLYFVANDGIHGRELWRTDGTACGTYMVIDIVPGPASAMPAYLTTATPCGPLFFAAHSDDHGMELWRSDGTEKGTYRISEIQAGYLGSSPHALTVAGSRLFFVAGNSATGEELWALDISDDIVVGDHDCDGETTLVDLSTFFPCMTGADDWTRPWCEWADFNKDDTIDLYDVALFQAAFGPKSRRNCHRRGND